MTIEVVEPPVKHSIPALRDKLDRNLRIIIALDDYARGGELKLGGLQFATPPLRNRLCSEKGRKCMQWWANSMGWIIFDLRFEAIRESPYENRNALQNLVALSEQLCQNAQDVLEHDWRVPPPPPFALTPEQRANLIRQFDDLENLLDRYCPEE